MKRFITTLTLLTASTFLVGCFGGGGSDQTPQQQLQQAQQQLIQQRASTEHWQLAVGVLAIAVVIAFFIGAMLGSRTRRNAKRPDTDGQ